MKISCSIMKCFFEKHGNIAWSTVLYLIIAPYKQ